MNLIMKENYLSMKRTRTLVAMLLAVMIGGLSSCKSDGDDSVMKDVKPQDIIGSWYTEYDKAGVYGEGEKARDFAKVVLYGSLYEGNTGVWVCLLVDADGKAVDLEDEFLGAGCDYTISNDGKINFKLTGNSSAVTLIPQWTMTYQGGQLVGKVRDDMECRLSRITEAQEVKFQNWMRQLGLGYDDTPDTPEGTNLVDLSTITDGHYTANDGDILTGQLSHANYDGDHEADCTVTIPDGATITLRDATIGGQRFLEQNYWASVPAINCQGSATIYLEGTNEVSGNYEDTPCIYVKPYSTLTITSREVTSFLKVNNEGRDGSAIGGGTRSGQYPECGNIVIRRCKVEASSLNAGIPIGCAEGGKCGDIYFEDGCEVYARNNYNGVSIGTYNGGTCGEIFILENSKVTAFGGWGGAPAIGASGNGRCKRIVTSGTVMANIENTSKDPLPINAWINADVIQLNRRLNKDFNGYMIKDGLSSKRDGLIPPMKRNGSEFIIYGGE